MTGIYVTPEQRAVLIEDALDASGAESVEERYADVIADLAMGRPVGDRDLLIRFLWRHLTLALEGLDAPCGLPVWHASVRLLEDLGEDLSDIYAGRTCEEVVERNERLAALLRVNPDPTREAYEAALRKPTGQEA